MKELQKRPLIFTIDEVLSPDECVDWIAWAEDLGFRPASIIGQTGVTFDERVRNNHRVVTDDSVRAKQLFERVRSQLPHLAGWGPTGFNERLRIYRYDPGEMFRTHKDSYFERVGGERSRLTVLIYLSDAFEGGGTWFEHVKLAPVVGQGIFFEHDQLHAGVKVTAGRKYVLRSDVMYFPDFSRPS